MKQILIYLVAVLGSAGVISIASPITPLASAAGTCNDARLLTFPAWYRGISSGDVPNCTIDPPGKGAGKGEFSKDLTSYITIIALNVVEILLQLAAYICIGFIIWGGFLYITAAGSSGGISSAKTMILNAVIGLVISLFAVIAVSFIVGRLGI